jgi:hypothetical protein
MPGLCGVDIVFEARGVSLRFSSMLLRLDKRTSLCASDGMMKIKIPNQNFDPGLTAQPNSKNAGHTRLRKKIRGFEV